MMKNFLKRASLILIVLLNLCGLKSVGECREVVFVLNSGQSMSYSDPFKVAPESIVWATQNFSAVDEVGIVAFKDEARVIRQLSKVGDNPAQKLFIDYYGQSNAGAGLLTAIDMLSPKFETERDIILITDGEINNSQSTTNFQAGLKQAQWLGISVYLIDLRHNVDPKHYRGYDNVKFLPINYNELLTTIRTILQGDFKTPHISMPTDNLSNGSLKFEVPVTAAKDIQISLFSTKTGNAQLKNIHPSNNFQGNYVKIFDIKSPTTNQIEIAIDYPQGAGLALDVMPTVQGTLQTKHSTRYWIKEILEITPVYENSPDKKILSDKFFEGKRINLQVNDKNFLGEIDDGVIQIPLDDLEENISLQKVHFEDVGINFEGNDTAQLVAPKSYYGAWLIALAGVLLIGGLSLSLIRKKFAQEHEAVKAMLNEEKTVPPVDKNSTKLVENAKVSYSGKLVIYVTRLSEDEDFEPREFNLFRMNVEKIPLSYVLENCRLFGIFPNAKYIFINPEKQGISLQNDSECTITKRNTIVGQGEHVELYYNDSVNIVSKDETAEMIMMYKSLKPV